MSRATIRKVFRFEASHQLPNHDGKCANLHGHSYKVEVEARGSIIAAGQNNPKEGMVVDFGDIKKAWKPIHKQLDHTHLNDSLGKEVPVTTAEHLATWILCKMSQKISTICAIRVHETETSSAYVTLKDIDYL